MIATREVFGIGDNSWVDPKELTLTEESVRIDNVLYPVSVGYSENGYWRQ